MDDAETLQTLERCFVLIQDQHTKEKDGVESTTNSTPSSASSVRITVTSYIGRFLTRGIFDRIKHRQTRLDHNLFDLIWPAMKKVARHTPVDEELNAGIILPDFDGYVVFQEFMVPLIKDLHCLDPNQSFTPQPGLTFFSEDFFAQNKEQKFNLNLDTSGKWIHETTVECCRNLENFELPLNLNLAQLEQAERMLTGRILSMDFARAIGEKQLGVYYTMNEILTSKRLYNQLQSMGLLIPLLNPDDPDQQPESVAINNQFWPYGRGVYLSDTGDLVAWINAQDHVRIVCTSKLHHVADIGSCYFKISKAMEFLEHNYEFRHSYFLGNLSSRPAFLGTAMKLNVLVSLPRLSKDTSNLRHVCNARGLNMQLETNDTLVRLSNMQSLGVTEWKIFQDFCTAVVNLLQLERDVSNSGVTPMTDSFMKLFRTKK